MLILNFVNKTSYKSSGWTVFAPPVQVGSADPALGWKQTALTEGSLYSRALECGSGNPIKAGTETLGMETPGRGGVDLAEVWQSRSGPVRPTVPLIRPHISSSVRAGCHGADVRILPHRSSPGSSSEASPEQSSPVASGVQTACIIGKSNCISNPMQ